RRAGPTTNPTESPRGRPAAGPAEVQSAAKLLVAPGRPAPQPSPAAIDADRLAGDERGLVRGQERDHRGDLVGAAEAAHRDRFGAFPEAEFEVVAIFAAVGADRARGADRAGADGVDGDPERRQVEGERFG